jgi:hypothetical protein
LTVGRLGFRRGPTASGSGCWLSPLDCTILVLCGAAGQDFLSIPVRWQLPFGIDRVPALRRPYRPVYGTLQSAKSTKNRPATER